MKGSHLSIIVLVILAFVAGSMNQPAEGDGHNVVNMRFAVPLPDNKDVATSYMRESLFTNELDAPILITDVSITCIFARCLSNSIFSSSREFMLSFPFSESGTYYSQSLTTGLLINPGESLEVDGAYRGDLTDLDGWLNVSIAGRRLE
jgi:hypothetical protein